MNGGIVEWAADQSIDAHAQNLKSEELKNNMVWDDEESLQEGSANDHHF